MVYIVFLLLSIVSLKYASEKTLRRINEVQNNIKAYRASSIAFEAELMRVNRPSLIIEKVQERGMEIHNPTKPPKELRVEKLKD